MTKKETNGKDHHILKGCKEGVNKKVMDIYYVGEAQGGMVFQLPSKNNNLEFACSGTPDNNYNEVADKLYSISPKYIIVSLGEVSNDECEFINIIQGLTKTLNSTIIVYAPELSEDVQIIQRLSSVGVKHFLFTTDNTKLQEQYLQIIQKKIPKQQEKKELTEKVTKDLHSSTKHKYIGDSKAKKTLPKTEKKPLKETKEIKSDTPVFLNKGNKIAVIGSMPRIGTTTIALQFVKYFTSMGKTACYIERNDTDYIKNLLKIIHVEKHDEDLSEVVHKHTNMYYNPNKIISVMNKGYDYYVFDYGEINNQNIDIASVLEKDVIIVVCGIKPNEMNASTNIIERFYDNNTPYYIFNSVSEDERDSVLKDMEKKSSNTKFADYSPDPFIFCQRNATLFTQIMTEPKDKEIS